MDYRVVKGEGSRSLGDYVFTKSFSAMSFTSVLCLAKWTSLI